MTSTTTKAMAMAFTLLVLAGGPTFASEGTRTIVGRVASVDRETLVIRMKGDTTVAVKLGDGTLYVKWITQKPWQQSTAADASFLKVGKLVAVETLAEEASPKARIVRIATN